MSDALRSGLPTLGQGIKCYDEINGVHIFAATTPQGLSARMDPNTDIFDRPLNQRCHQLISDRVNPLLQSFFVIVSNRDYMYFFRGGLADRSTDWHDVLGDD